MYGMEMEAICILMAVPLLPACCDVHVNKVDESQDGR